MNEVLKSGISISASGGVLRKGMIVLQFVIAVFLIVATIIVTSQLNYIQDKELGYDKESVMILPADFRAGAGFEEMKMALLQIPGINSVTGAYESPGFVQWSDGLHANTSMGEKNISINAIPAELDFTKTLNMQLLAGRDFIKADLLEMDTSNNGANYKASFILNESAAKAMGWSPEQAIGKTVDRGVSGTVKGVVKDFHFASLHQPIGPLVIFLDPNMVQQIFVKVNHAGMPQTIAAMEKVWKARIQHRPFEYRFLDEDFAELYVTEQKTAQVFSLFAGMAILLACLGLFALSAFVTVQRTKEIGIRKVLGATRSQIVMLLSREFLVLVSIGMLIAMPLAWWAGHEWLNDFAYRTNIGAWMFLLAAVVATAIAFVSVALQSARAAGANPVNSLKN
jgi:putative ABC transport system permease protein